MMISRSQLVAVLVALEVVIAGEMVVAIRGDQQPAEWSPWHSGAAAASGPNLTEGGSHQVFSAGAHPAVTVDIGYADLTIRTGDAAQIDVAVSKSSDFGIFRGNGPISAAKVGETVRIEAAGAHSWSAGDNRMVTVIVPPNTRVTVEKAGDIKAQGLRADASFQSVGNGTITIEDYDSHNLTVAASDGRITLQRVSANHLDATTSDGRIEGTGLLLRDGNIESDDGRVSLGFAAGTNALVNAETSDGKIRVSGIPGASSETKSNDDDDASSRSVRIGAGEGRLDVRSSDGSIYLNQEN
jgi:Putative adhesin